MGTTEDLIQRGKAAVDTIRDGIAGKLQDAAGTMGDLALSAARLLHPKDRSIPSFTLYISENLGIQTYLDKQIGPGAGQIMGLFVPEAVKARDKVNVILYMHGDKGRIVKPNFTIVDYWSLGEMPLREGVQASGQPYILLAPTFGADADTQFGTMGSKIDQHLEHAMVELHRYGAPEFATTKPPEIGDVILAGHSGAFGPMSSILSNMKKYRQNVKEIWGFDIMYGNALWSQLAAVKVPVYAYYVGTAKHSIELANRRRPNVFVMKGVEYSMQKGKEVETWVPHDNLMQHFWLDRLRRIGTNGTNPEDRKRLV